MTELHDERSDARIRALERKMSILREKLANTEEIAAFYRLIFEKSTAPTIVVEQDYTISKCNERMEKLLGYTKGRIAGKIKWPEVVVKEDHERMKRYHHLRRINPNAAPKEYECRFMSVSGEVFDIQIKMDMIPGTTTSVATLINVTQRKKAEKCLLQREEELRAIVENFPGYIYTTHVDYRIEFINRLLVEKHGKSSIGKTCYQALFGFDTPCPWCEHKRVFGGKTIRSEIWNPEEHRWYAMVSTPILDGNKRVQKRQTILIDITEQKLTEERLKSSAALLKKENILLKSTMKDRYRFGDIVGKSDAMQKVYKLILRAAASNANLIIYGESGTGKELVAKSIHQLSDRSESRFVPVNCGAIPEHLMESEFFGYLKGAFTGASSDKQGYLDMADGGTLFLDELGEISLSMQVKLLRAIEGGGFIPLGGKCVKKPDIKIIAATNQNLVDMINQGAMREDFFYRVHVIPIHLPPLRERKSDIPLLIEHFMASYDSEKNLPEIDTATLDAFLRYPWPGNIRELQNVLNRYLTLGSVDFIPRRSPSPAPESPQPAPQPMLTHEEFDLQSVVVKVQKTLILRALEKVRWHRGKTAQLLGISRRTLERKMTFYGIRDSG